MKKQVFYEPLDSWCQKPCATDAQDTFWINYHLSLASLGNKNNKAEAGILF